MIGSWINTGSHVVAEIMAASGFDFLVVDAEHSPIDVPQAHALFQAIKSGNPDCRPMVRLTGNDPDETKRYLDAGAMGVIFPMIMTKADTEVAVRSVLYPPYGSRGVGYCRANGYGFDFEAYTESANDEIEVWLQIEHIQAINNLENVLHWSSNITGVFIGPYDLTASMRITGQFDHPDYIAAVNKVVRVCQDKDIRLGMHVVQPDPGEVITRIVEGFDTIAYSLDITMIGKACRDGLAEITKFKEAIRR